MNHDHHSPDPALGEDGKPTAALIPWEQFEAIRKLLKSGNDDDEISPEWREEIH